MASVGPGTSFHIGFATFTRMAHVNMTYVPYAGSAPAVNAVLGEHVTSVFTGYAVVAEHLKAGKLRALAAATLKRIAPLPDVPTFDESGFPGLEVDNWFGIVAPAKTPKDTLSQLAGWFTAALALPEVQGEACRSGSLSRGQMRRGFLGAGPQAIRRIRRGHSRREHQGRVARRHIAVTGAAHREWAGRLRVRCSIAGAFAVCLALPIY